MTVPAQPVYSVRYLRYQSTAVNAIAIARFAEQDIHRLIEGQMRKQVPAQGLEPRTRGL